MHVYIFLDPFAPLQVHSGWMRKKGHGMVLGSKMQRRHFILYDNRELHYFEARTTEGVGGGSFALEGLARKGSIRMATATKLARHRPSDSKDFTFVIKVPGRDFVLDPGSEAAYQEWEAKLRPMLG